MTLISKFVILSLFITIFYFIGLLKFVTDYEENRCDMTYMFEYPQFVKIKMPYQDQYPRYGLYAYSEGKLTEKARAMKFNGIPVLFVPGNAGSYKQVRSLASVALRKALNSRTGYHFDFFTLDLNNELSGLNGAVLEDQTNFLNHSLYRILNLYNIKQTNNVPNSVIVIGHSMGGIIAQNIIDSFDNVHLLITLASPHRRPAIIFDSYTADYYNQLTIKSENYSDFVKNKTMITIGGGYQDHLVNSWLTNSNFSSLNVITTTIPKVWLSTDHACITWCKQFVFTVVRALFDSIDLKTTQLSTNSKYRASVFKHHLLKNSGINIRWADRYKVIVRFDDRGDWKEDIRRLYSVNFPKGTQNNQWLMVRIVDDPKHEALFVQANNLAVTDWIFACTADNIRGHSRYCDSGIHLSHLSKIAPSTKLKRRTHYVNLVRLKKRYPKITHLVVRVLPTPQPVSIHFDVHNPNDRIINIKLPRWFSLSRTNVIQRTEPNALRYEINLIGLQHIIQSYLMYVEPVNCAEDIHHATVSLSVPWANHDSLVFITETIRKPLVIRLHGSRPIQKSNLTAKVYLTLDPTCQYTVTVRNSFVGMLGQFSRFYTPLLVANIAAVILMSFRSQLNALEEKKQCSLFQTSLSMSTKPYYLVTGVKLLSKIIPLISFLDIIPQPDSQILIDENTDFLILPLLLYVTSVGLTYLLTLVLWAGIIMNESTVHKLVGKFFTRAVGKTFKLSDWFINAMHRVPCVVAVTLICLGLTTCGGLALCLGMVYYFLKLTQLCEDYIEDLVYGYVKNIACNILKPFFKRFRKSNEPNENVNEKENDQNIQEVEDNEATEFLTNKENKTIDDLEKELEQSEQDNKINNMKVEQMNVDKQKTEKNMNEDKSEETSEVVESINQNNEEKQTNKTDEDHVSGNNGMHFHFTLFLIWFLVSGLNIPSVLTWAHNFQYNNVLSPDPSSIFGIILCLCAIPLWQLDLPKANKCYYKELGYFIYSMAVLSLIYAQFNLYRLSYILTLTLVVTTVHQVFAPNIPEEDSPTEDDSFNPVTLMKDIKTKLE